MSILRSTPERRRRDVREAEYADTHCHLDDPAFAPDLAEVIQRATESGVRPIVAPAESLPSAKRILEIAAVHPSVLPCVGVHPHKAQSFDESQMPLFESMADRPEVVGIGEIGLDYYYEFSPPDTQRRTLSFFIELATRLNKPACLHVRDKSGESRAVDDLLGALRPLAGRLRGVVHCFSGGFEEARRILDLGLHLSFTGILTFKNASALRDVFARLPADRILLETDAPYLAPDPHRGHRNEPMFLTRIFTLSAGLLRLAEPDWSDRLRLNQTQVFGPACA